MQAASLVDWNPTMETATRPGTPLRRRMLSTTDAAAHLAGRLKRDVSGLSLSRIDPKVETQR